MEVGSYFPKIVSGNNSIFTYNIQAQPSAGKNEQKEIDFENGLYKVADIDRRHKETVGEHIKIEVYQATGQSRVKVSPGFIVQFFSFPVRVVDARKIKEKKASTLLGYKDDVVHDKILNVSPHMSNVLASGKVFIELNVIIWSWADMKEDILWPSQVLYSFSSAVKWKHPINIWPTYRKERLLLNKNFNELLKIPRRTQHACYVNEDAGSDDFGNITGLAILLEIKRHLNDLIMTIKFVQQALFTL